MMLVVLCSEELPYRDVQMNNPYQSGHPSTEKQAPVPGMAANTYMPVAPTLQAPPIMHFGRTPIQCVCPRCRANILTRLEHRNGALAWLICVILVLVGCGLGCCLIPFCIDDLGNVEHYCPQCAALLGEYRPLWIFLSAFGMLEVKLPFQIYVFLLTLGYSCLIDLKMNWSRRNCYLFIEESADFLVWHRNSVVGWSAVRFILPLFARDENFAWISGDQYWSTMNTWVSISIYRSIFLIGRG